MEHSFLVLRRKALAILVGTIAASVVALAPQTEVRAVAPPKSYGIVKVIPVGNNPSAIAITPDGTRAYVTNTGSNSVSVINTATGTVTATINVGNNPTAIASTTTSAYVTNGGSNTVSVIDIATNTTTSAIAVGANPSAIAVTPNGAFAYVTNASSNNVSVINTATGTVSATINVGNSPNDIDFNQAGTRAYVSNYNGSSVSVIDTTTNPPSLIGGSGAGRKPLALAINASGEGVIIADASGALPALLMRFNPTTLVFDTGPGITDATKVTSAGGNSSLFYVITSTGDLQSYNYGNPNGGMNFMGTVGTNASALTVAPGGQFPIYIASPGTPGTVTVIDELTPTITPQTGAEGTAVTVTVTPSNIAYNIDDNAVTDVKFGGVAASTITPGAGNTWTVTAPAGSGAAAVVVTFGWLQQPNYLALGYRQASAGTFTYPGGSSGGGSSTAIVFLYHVSLDPGGGVCVVNGEPTTMSTRTPFLGYSYIPSTEECVRAGFTFQGWAATTKPGTVLSLPLLRSWDDGIWRYFIADNHDLIAVWNPST